MTQCKFRAWDGKRMLNRILYDRNWYDADDKCIRRAMPRDSNILKVMQFTGLLDKKKKEAYESDIIQTFYDDRRKGDVGYLECTNLGSLCLVVNGKPTPIPLCVYAEWEIIGNIHENPELI